MEINIAMKEYFVLFCLHVVSFSKCLKYILVTQVLLGNFAGRQILAMSLIFKSFKEVLNFGHIQILQILQI